MRFAGLKRGLVTFVIVLVAVALLLSGINTALRKWPKLGCEFHDVDINTGRTRQARYLLYFKTSEKVEDSILTRMIGQFPDGIQPDWRPVNTFPLTGRRISPHYSYHGAIAQIRQVEMMWHSSSFSDEAKRNMAQTILDRWQSDGNYFGAGKYLRKVWNTALDKTESNPAALISVADLGSIPNE
jgi:hypothetical protein